MYYAAWPSHPLLAPPAGPDTQLFPSRAVDARSSTSQLEALTRLRSRLHARMIDLIAECDDAGEAVAEGHMEQALGVPCFAMEALHARLAERKAAVAALRTQLAQLEAACS